MEKEKTEDQISSKNDEPLQKKMPQKKHLKQSKKDVVEKNPEEKISELEEKIVRQYAEMENQRRRYEKEKDDAFEYGGFSFAKETLNLIDNLERSKTTIKNDEELKIQKVLKKLLII